MARFQKGNDGGKGRPPGSKDRISKAVAAAMVEQPEMSPLMTILKVMRHYTQEFEQAVANGQSAAAERAAELAVEAAGRAAPYVHARALPSPDDRVRVLGPVRIGELTSLQLEELFWRLDTAISSGGDDAIN
jgi:hypothetical protein